MATITKRGETFRIRVSIGYDSNGKQIVKSTTFRPPSNVTPKKAEKLANEFATEFENRCKGMVNYNENMRFSELVEWYLENYAKNMLKEISAYNYKGQIEKHLLPEYANTKLKDFSSAKITTFFNKKQLKPSTCRKVYIILQSLFARAVEQGFIKETPCKNVILPKPKEDGDIDEKKPCMDEKQLKEFLGMLDGYSQFNTIIKMLLLTGIRSGECLGLRWEDIDFEHRLIHIRYSLADVGGKHYLTPPKTKSSIRYIMMNDTVKALLLEHKENQQEIIKTMGKAFEHPEMVFTSETGKYKDRGALLKSFKRFFKGTQFEDLTLHDLRHCNATFLIMNGIDIKSVSAHLGHCNIGVTADIYTDVLASQKAKMAEIMDIGV